MRTARSQAFAHLCLTILLAAFVIAAPARASAQAKKVTVTMGNPGDHWLDAMQYTRVARAQRDRQFGYEVTYLVPGLGEHQLFWPRSKIDLDGSSPRRYHTQFIQLEQGRLYLPDRITAKSLPKVHRAILILEGDYTKQARGGKAAAEAFATVFTLAGALPARASSAVASRSSTSTASTRTTARPSAAKPAAKPSSTSPGSLHPRCSRRRSGNVASLQSGCPEPRSDVTSRTDRPKAQTQREQSDHPAGIEQPG